MDDETLPTMHGTKTNRRIRVVVAVVLTAIVAFGSSRVGSGRAVSQPREPAPSAATQPSHPSDSATEYSVTVTNDGGSVVTTTRTSDHR
jgi:hypothetical protein